MFNISSNHSADSFFKILTREGLRAIPGHFNSSVFVGSWENVYWPF